jgi:hypothetical protein
MANTDQDKRGQQDRAAFSYEGSGGATVSGAAKSSWTSLREFYEHNRGWKWLSHIVGIGSIVGLGLVHPLIGIPAGLAVYALVYCFVPTGVIKVREIRVHE